MAGGSGRSLLTLLVGMQISATTLEISMEFLKILKAELP
jgi:hypothetical protein